MKMTDLESERMTKTKTKLETRGLTNCIQRKRKGKDKEKNEVIIKKRKKRVKNNNKKATITTTRELYQEEKYKS